MKHYIIVKFTPEVQDKPALIARVRSLYAAASEIPGVAGAEVIPCCIDRPNRFDLMIIVHMDKAALPTWDDSRLHHDWKEQFGQYVEKKTIFDAED